MNKPKIIILNCPPRSGKDSIADLYEKNNNNVKKRSFKDQLFSIAFTISGIPKQEWFERYENHKDEPWNRLGGLSQRNYLIKISEEWVKPVHGKDYFGQMLAASITDDSTYIIPDGGFKEEIVPVVTQFDTKQCLILQWGRLGFNFDNDSRDWITSYPDITRRIPDNNNDIMTHYNRVVKEINDYFTG